jgi:tetratricopeptide (TPR) repeat protein
MMSNKIGACLVLALVCFAQAVMQAQSGSEDPSDRYADEGQQALAAGRFGEARTDFEQLAKLHPEVAEVHASLAAIYFKLGEYQLAVDAVRTAQKLKPGLPRLDSLLGLSLSEMSRFDEALPHLEKSFKQTADVDTRRMAGLQLLRAYTGLGRDSDAVETALALNKAYPDDPEVLYQTGRIYGNFAYLVMTKLHDDAPNSVWMLQAQGEANEAQKDYEGAIVAFNHVLEIDPHRPGIHYRLGRVYLARFRDTHKEEDRAGAMREFAAELAGDPANGNAAYELAVMTQQQGDLEGARKQFETVVGRYPGFEEALVGLGGVYLELQKADLALTALQHAIKLNPDDEVAWYRLGQAARETGNRAVQRQAMDTFQKLRDTAKGTPRHTDQELTPQQLGADANVN